MQGGIYLAAKTKSLDDLLQAGLTIDQAKQIFLNEVEHIENEDYKIKLTKLFSYALEHNPSLFSGIRIQELIQNNKKEDNLLSDILDIDSSEKSIYEQMASEYIQKWCRNYVSERNNPSIKKALKNFGEKDSALTARIKANTNASDEILDNYVTGHFLYMSAENMNGSILEEYLCHVLEPENWLWCAGAVYRAIDFCYFSENHTVLLQVKNKYNTENSSSSAIRIGTDIIKWNRLNRPSKASPDLPIPNWNKLQSLINVSEGAASKLNEESYLKFIEDNSTKELLTLGE